MIVRQTEAPINRPKFPWLPPGNYSEIEVFRDRRGLGDFVQILGACEQLQLTTKTPVKLFGQPGIISIGEHSAVQVFEAPKITRRHGVCEKLGRDKVRVYLDYPCPSEGNEIPGNRIDRLTLFHRALGVEPNNPSLVITEREQEWAANWCDQVTGAQHPIVMVYRSAEKWKDFHDPDRLFSLLKKIGPAVCLENQAKVWSTPNTYGMTLRENAAILNQARIVVTPDTGWLHVAGHLKRPIFGLFGAQDPAYRQSIYNVTGSYHQGTCPYRKSPCWYNVCRGKTDIQPCMQTDPLVIADLVEKTIQRIETKWDVTTIKPLIPINEMSLIVSTAGRVGSTWLCDILSTMINKPWSPLDRELTSDTPLTADETKQLKAIQPGIYKTHAYIPSVLNPVLSDARRMITLNRNPYDSLVSWLMYCRHNRPANNLINEPWFDEFRLKHSLLNDRDFINQIITDETEMILNHIETHRSYVQEPGKFNLSLQYEDFLQDLPNQIVKIANFIGISITLETIDHISRLNSKEVLSLRYNKGFQDNAKFVRACSANQWQEIFTVKSFQILEKSK